MTGADWLGIAATANNAFLLAFSSLFSIINPVGGASFLTASTRGFSHARRTKVAAPVGLYSLLIMFGALWGGVYVLNFFGVSLDALRIAGGLVVTTMGWRQLTSGDQHADRKNREAQVAAEDAEGDPMQLAFFPSPCPSPPGPARSRSPSPSAPFVRLSISASCPSSSA